MSDQVRTGTGINSVGNRGVGQAEAIYSICQVSELLGVAPIEVVQWLKNGWLPCRQKPNEPIRISQSQLVVFLRNRGIDLEAILAKTVLKEARQPRPAAPAVVNPPTTKPVAAYREALAMTGQWQPQTPPTAKAEPESESEPEDAPDPIDLEPSPMADVPPPAPVRETSVTSAKADDRLASAAEKILTEAVGLRATALHLEITDNSLSLALRIDGTMCSLAIQPPTVTGEELARQFKTLSAMPAGGAAPQSGKFSLTCSGKDVDFSIFTCQTTGGEKLVISISDPRKAEETSSPSLCDADEQAIRTLLAQQAGIIVVTGSPRGGRSEMLRMFARRIMKACPKGTISAAAVVASSATPAMQIRELPGVSYVRFDPAGGFSCAQAVQNCASLDADLILAENLQDPPTLLAAARAAEQGRLVLAGMGAASVGSALAVLREMNLSDWPLASVLLGVVAVATVRRLCPHCKQAHEPSAAMLSDLGLGCEKFTLPLYLAKGCPKCAQTGYAGTIPLVSILKTDRIIAAMIRRGEMAEVIEQAGKSSGLRTLRQAAMEHLRSGATSISEVARACPPEL